MTYNAALLSRQCPARRIRNAQQKHQRQTQNAVTQVQVKSSNSFDMATASGDGAESISPSVNIYDREKNNSLLAYMFMSPSSRRLVDECGLAESNVGLRAGGLDEGRRDWVNWKGAGGVLERRLWAFETIEVDSKPGGKGIPFISAFSK